MIKKPNITGNNAAERQRQMEAYLAFLCEEIDRELSVKTLNTFLDSAITVVKTANSEVKVSERAKFAVTRNKLIELLKLLGK